MIPKIIHYCWFGGNPLGENEKKCIASWKKFFPDYEIKLWDESNYDVNKISYTKHAYQEKKYAFVSDYARFDILYQYGGIYFDTDVEVIRPMDDIIRQGAFMGCELGLAEIAVAPGLGMAAEAKQPFYQEVLQYYESLQWFPSNNEKSNQTVVSIVTNLLRKKGLKKVDKIQKIEDILIYPEEYFCPMHSSTHEINIVENTYTIHHYSASWMSEEQKQKTKEVGEMCKYLWRPLAVVIVAYKYEIRRNGWFSVFGYTCRKMRKYIKRLVKMF